MHLAAAERNAHILEEEEHPKPLPQTASSANRKHVAIVQR
jgi:hypothetical protein